MNGKASSVEFVALIKSLLEDSEQLEPLLRIHQKHHLTSLSKEVSNQDSNKTILTHFECKWGLSTSCVCSGNCFQRVCPKLRKNSHRHYEAKIKNCIIGAARNKDDEI